MAKKVLKDINKDGKRNFKDTWLGDFLGADGKLGVEKGNPRLGASMKGARREVPGEEKKASTSTKSTAKAASKESVGRTSMPVPKPKAKAAPKPTTGLTDSQRRSLVAVGRPAKGEELSGKYVTTNTKPKPELKEAQRTALKSVGPIGGRLSEIKGSRLSDERTDRRITKSTARPSFDVSYDQWLKMTPAKRKELGLPATYGAVQRFFSETMTVPAKGSFKFQNKKK